MILQTATTTTTATITATEYLHDCCSRLIVSISMLCTNDWVQHFSVITTCLWTGTRQLAVLMLHVNLHFPCFLFTKHSIVKYTGINYSLYYAFRLIYYSKGSKVIDCSIRAYNPLMGREL